MYKFDNELAEKEIASSAFLDYYVRLKNLACTMFKWEGLPESVNERFLERCLYLQGRAVFFNSDTRGYLGLNASLEDINIYDEPLRIRPITPVTSFPVMDADKCVLIRNTPDMYPTFITTRRYAKMLYDIDASIDVNIAAQKTPVLLLTDQKQKQTAMAVYQKYKGNTPVIFGVKDVFDPNAFKVLRTDAPFVAGQLQDIKITKYNEYLAFLGIGMADYKTERRVTGEVEQFNRQANALANIGLSQREEACRKINALYNLNVSVHLASEAYTTEGAKYSKNSYNATYTKNYTDDIKTDEGEV